MRLQKGAIVSFQHTEALPAAETIRNANSIGMFMDKAHPTFPKPEIRSDMI